MRIIHSVIWIILAYKLGDWKNIKKYIPTLLFWGFGNCVYELIFFNKPLWLFIDPIFKSHIIVTFFNIFTVFFVH